MSDTPETDAQLTTFTSISKLKKHFVNRTGTVSADFARGLERERNEARAERDEWIARFRADEELIKEAMAHEHLTHTRQ